MITETPSLWGGEVGQAVNPDKDRNLILTLEPITQLSLGNGLTDILSISKPLRKQSYTTATTNLITPLETSVSIPPIRPSQ